MASQKKTRIAEVLGGAVLVGATVRVSGWVRTRRDSKGGVSFVALHDGSCFATLQLVVENTLPNYADEVLKLTAGCALTCVGEVVASQGKGQSVELRATSIEVVGSLVIESVADGDPFSRSRTRRSSCATTRTCGRART